MEDIEALEGHFAKVLRKPKEELQAQIYEKVRAKPTKPPQKVEKLEAKEECFLSLSILTMMSLFIVHWDI